MVPVLFSIFIISALVLINRANNTVKTSSKLVSRLQTNINCRINHHYSVQQHNTAIQYNDIDQIHYIFVSVILS